MEPAEGCNSVPCTHSTATVTCQNVRINSRCLFVSCELRSKRRSFVCIAQWCATLHGRPLVHLEPITFDLMRWCPHRGRVIQPIARRCIAHGTATVHLRDGYLYTRHWSCVGSKGRPWAGLINVSFVASVKKRAATMSYGTEPLIYSWTVLARRRQRQSNITPALFSESVLLSISTMRHPNSTLLHPTTCGTGVFKLTKFDVRLKLFGPVQDHSRRRLFEDVCWLCVMC